MKLRNAIKKREREREKSRSLNFQSRFFYVFSKSRKWKKLSIRGKNANFMKKISRLSITHIKFKFSFKDAEDLFLSLTPTDDS